MLFEKHQEAVRARLRVAGIQGADLDELFQAVFSVACRRISIVPANDEEAKYWLLDVARKQAANFRRLYRHVYEVVNTEIVEAAPEDPDEDTEQSKALRDAVRQAAAQLSEEDREILLRHDVAGETLAEVAKWLGLTKSGAYARLHQARNKFVDAFELVQEEKRGRRHGLSALLLALWGALKEWVAARILEIRERLSRIPGAHRARGLLGAVWSYGPIMVFWGIATAVIIYLTTPKEQATAPPDTSGQAGGVVGEVGPENPEGAGKGDGAWGEGRGDGFGCVGCNEAGAGDKELASFQNIAAVTNPDARRLLIKVHLERFPDGKYALEIKQWLREMRAKDGGADAGNK